MMGDSTADGRNRGIAPGSGPSITPELNVQSRSVERIGAIDWSRIAGDLDDRGYATLGTVLTPAECAEFAKRWDDESTFRKRVVMEQHGFGRGEYRYFAYPLPDAVAALRASLYPPLASVANAWERSLGRAGDFPAEHAQFLERCHAAGQRRPTPLLLKYGEGDFNCLHQDLYGEIAFPLQVVFLLSAPGSDFTGGEFVLTEQRPRAQSRVEVIPLEQGQGVVFAVSQRPVRGSRGAYRVSMRHGVSRLRSGGRLTLGIIFHDAA